MILRRVIEHVKAQNWFAVAIDFVIVVIGVFFGLQVSNWNATRSDARAFGEALDRLRGEIAANFEALDLADSDIAAELPAVRAAYDALETCSDTPETRGAVDAGLKHIGGANGIRLRGSELAQLTTEPRFLALQPPEVRRRLSDLSFYQDLVLTSAAKLEEYPRLSHPERSAALRPGPRGRHETTYLGIAISQDRRQLQLSAPVSEACRNTDLVAALWAWDRSQSSLSFLIQTMRQEYQQTLDLLDRETRP